MKRWWVRWYGRGPFTYHGPWWESGLAHDAAIFVAAVVAPDEAAARAVIESAYDAGAAGIKEWSFVQERDPDWRPSSDRFPWAEWMKWPWPEQPKRYYIQNKKHYAGDFILWWEPNRNGYTYDIDKAGLYSEEEAKGIEANRDEDLAIPEEIAQAAIRRAVDVSRISIPEGGWLK